MRRFPTASIIAFLASGRVSGHSTGKDPLPKAREPRPIAADDVDYTKLAAETFGIVKGDVACNAAKGRDCAGTSAGGDPYGIADGGKEVEVNVR